MAAESVRASPVTKLFLSHAAEDGALAEAVAERLRRLGLDVVQMAARLQSAEDWSERIRVELEGSDAALFLVTPNFVDRPWFFIEWAAAWIQKKPPHLLLLHVTEKDLLGIMRETQVTSVGQHSDQLARLVATLTGRDEADVEVSNLGERLRRLIENAAENWKEEKWRRVTGTVAQGAAILPAEDLAWVVDNGYLHALLEDVRRDFAHPTLLHQLANYLLERGQATAAFPIADLVHNSVQTRLFRQLLREREKDMASNVAALVADRETRRECGRIAAAEGEPELATRIADMTEHSYDRRLIAESLFEHGAREAAAAVIERADKNYDKAAFALRCIAEESVGLALDVARTMTVNKDLRVVGEALLATDHDGELGEILECMTKNDEKRRLAVYAMRHDKPDAAEAVARTMTTSDDLLRLALSAWEEGEREVALRIVLLISLTAKRREFFEATIKGGEARVLPEAGALLKLSAERGLLARALVEAGRDAEASELASSLENDEHRLALFWAALAQGSVTVAESALNSITDPDAIVRCRAVLAAVARADEPFESAS
jgi:TIR domain